MKCDIPKQHATKVVLKVRVDMSIQGEFEPFSLWVSVTLLDNWNDSYCHIGSLRIWRIIR